jgi:hypothetical protein
MCLQVALWLSVFALAGLGLFVLILWEIDA